MVTDREPVIVLAGDGIWTRNLLAVLATNGYPAERRDFVWSSIDERQARNQVYVCSIPSPRDSKNILALRPWEHGARVAKFFGKGLEDVDVKDAEEGVLTLLKKEDPGFAKLLTWLKDSVSQAIHIAWQREKYCNEDIIEFLHDPK